MRKIPTLFLRDHANNSMITGWHDPDCQWVVDGEGIATRKYDGTPVLVRDGVLHRRINLPDDRARPLGFIPVEHDPATQKTVGWEQVPMNSILKENRPYHEAYDNWLIEHGELGDGTYELIGPKIMGNHESYDRHVFVSHYHADQLTDVPTDYADLRKWLNGLDIEGVVWHHADGRMAKVKLKDFGLRRTKSLVRQ